MAYADDKAAAQAATQEATQLADRLSEIGAEIDAKKEEIRLARIAAARAGTAPSADATVTTLEGELQDLYDELEDLPEQHMAAREDAAALEIAAETNLEAALKPQLETAEGELGPLEDALQDARAARDEKLAEVQSLRNQIAGARTRRDRHENLLVQISADGPRGPALFAGQAG